jgi:hypothetical protein
VHGWSRFEENLSPHQRAFADHGAGAVEHHQIDPLVSRERNWAVPQTKDIALCSEIEQHAEIQVIGFAGLSQNAFRMP